MEKNTPIYNRRAQFFRLSGELSRAGAPIDLSFKKAKTLKGLVNREDLLRISRTGKLPRKGPHERFLTSSIWLSNNALSSLNSLHDLVNSYLENPQHLYWLDLSYNDIGSVEDDLLKIQNLTILYLHGNKISDMKSIVKLRNFKKLRSLTLHGNPIEKTPDYRCYIVTILPQIQNLDFSPVIDYERKRALPAGFLKKLSANA